MSRTKAVKEMLLTGDFIDCDHAKSIGLINEHFETVEELNTHVDSIAFKIAGKSKEVIRYGKEVFNIQSALPVKGAYDVAGEAMIKNMMMVQAQEGIAAFLDKRKPRWDD
jgi:enoyl-CoA hydratase/carnithine racemase